MDEEDLAEMRESRKLVDANDQMDVDIWSSEGRKGDAAGEDSKKGQSLRWGLVVGGEGLDEQFEMISNNPDVYVFHCSITYLS